MKEGEQNHREQEGIFGLCPYCVNQRLALHKTENEEGKIERVCGTHKRNAPVENPASDEDIARVLEVKRETARADLNSMSMLRPGIESAERAYMMAGFHTGIDEFIDILKEGGDIGQKAIDSHIDWDTLLPMDDFSKGVHRTLLITSYHKGLITGLRVYEDKPPQ